MPALLVIWDRVVNRPLTCADVRSPRSAMVASSEVHAEFDPNRGVFGIDTPGG
jgi:hypothetical protein